MVNRISKEQRSYIMSCIRSSDTKPELLLRKALWARGLRYRLHSKIQGRPDIVFPGAGVAIFVDGDFWHGCDWPRLRRKLKNDFWYQKIRKNRARDRKTSGALRKQGWTVLRFWEHQVNSELELCVNTITKILNDKTGDGKADDLLDKAENKIV